jgi:hypothetical protein
VDSSSHSPFFSRTRSKTQPKFLLPEMKLWVNLQTHEQLEQLWSKLTLGATPK